MDYSRYCMPGVCVPYDEEQPPRYAGLDENLLLHAVSHAAFIHVLQGWIQVEPGEWLGASGGFWSIVVDDDDIVVVDTEATDGHDLG